MGHARQHDHTQRRNDGDGDINDLLGILEESQFGDRGERTDHGLVHDPVDREGQDRDEQRRHPPQVGQDRARRRAAGVDAAGQKGEEVELADQGRPRHNEGVDPQVARRADAHEDEQQGQDLDDEVAGDRHLELLQAEVEPVDVEADGQHVDELDQGDRPVGGAEDDDVDRVAAHGDEVEADLQAVDRGELGRGGGPVVADPGDRAGPVIVDAEHAAEHEHVGDRVRVGVDAHIVHAQHARDVGDGDQGEDQGQALVDDIEEEILVLALHRAPAGRAPDRNSRATAAPRAIRAAGPSKSGAASQSRPRSKDGGTSRSRSPRASSSVSTRSSS